MVFDPVEGDDGETHQIRAWATVGELRAYNPRPEAKEGLRLEFDGQPRESRIRDRRMFYCVCDPERHYRKEETALDHLREVGALG